MFFINLRVIIFRVIFYRVIFLRVLFLTVIFLGVIFLRVYLNFSTKISPLLPYLLWGGLQGPPSGIGGYSKMHLYIKLKVLDFSFISKIKILKRKKI